MFLMTILHSALMQIFLMVPEEPHYFCIRCELKLKSSCCCADMHRCYTWLWPSVCQFVSLIPVRLHHHETNVGLFEVLQFKSTKQLDTLKAARQTLTHRGFSILPLVLKYLFLFVWSRFSESVTVSQRPKQSVCVNWGLWVSFVVQFFSEQKVDLLQEVCECRKLRPSW